MNKQLAIVFPGQGSQGVGMLAALAERHPVVAETFIEAGEALDMDLWRLINQGPAEELDRTELTQPAMLAAGIAGWRVWRLLDGPTPDVMAGHSLGEYSALVAAGAMDFADAIRLVHERGRLMQAAVPAGVGAMAAILGLDDEVVEAICREAAEGQVVAPANYNSPGQLVIAGHAEAVERAMHRCREAGARRAVVLPVSVPSHCALMGQAAEAFGERLEATGFRAPEIPVLHNADVAAHAEVDVLRRVLQKQLCSPVQWTRTIRKMLDKGIDQFVECGPGKVLCGLGRRISRQSSWQSMESPDELEARISEWRES